MPVTATSSYAVAKSLLAYAIAHASAWATLTGLSNPTDLAARVIGGSVSADNLPSLPYCWITAPDGEPLRHTLTGVSAFRTSGTLWVWLAGAVSGGYSADETNAAAEADEIAGQFADLLRDAHMAVADASGTRIIIRGVQVVQEAKFIPRSQQGDAGSAAFESWQAVFAVALGDE